MTGKRPLLFVNFIILMSCATVFKAQGQSWLPPVEIEISDPCVSSIVQSTDGYLWLGTNRGLNRYNGVNYSVFYQGDSLALSNDKIWCMSADVGNRIWVGTSAGINLVKDSKVVRSPSAKFDPISAMAEYDADHLVCGGSEGIFLYDKSTEERRVVFPDARYPGHILVTFDKKIIAGGRAGDSEIFVLNKDLSLSSKFNLPGGRLNRGMVQSSDGTIFIATDKGILSYTGSLSEIPEWKNKVEQACGSSDPDVLFITEDRIDNNVVFGVAGGELYRINTTTQEVSRAWYNISLSDAKSGVCLITEDNLWLSTDAHPLVQDIRNNNILVVHFNEVGAKERISWIHNAGENMALVISYSDVFLMNMTTGAYRVITPPDRKGQKVWINRTCFDSDNNLWIVTTGMELLQYRLNGNELNKISERIIESCQAIWPNEGGGINFIDKSSIWTINNGTASRRPLNRGESSWRLISHSSGSKYFLHDEKIFQYTSDGQFYELPINTEAVSSVSEDHSGRIWIGKMNSGLQCYDPITRNSVEYTEKDGLNDNTIRSIAFNDSGTWGATRNSIFHINNDGEILPISISFR